MAWHVCLHFPPRSICWNSSLVVSSPLLSVVLYPTQSAAMGACSTWLGRPKASSRDSDCGASSEQSSRFRSRTYAKQKKRGGGAGSYGGDAEPSGAQLVAPTLTCPAWAAVTCPFSTNQARSFSKVDSRWRWKSRRSGASREVPLTSGPLRTSLKASAMMRSA